MQHFSPLQWIKISMANSYGNDKVSYQERIDFIDDAIKNDKLQDLLDNADEPNMFFAGYEAYTNVMSGIPTGFKVGLDATSSGPQVIGIQTGDESCCKLCNVIPTGKRMDLYTEIYDEMRRRDPNMPSDISRGSVKKGVMTSLYGSTSIPKKVFGDEYLPLFKEVCKDLMPNASAFTECVLENWDTKAKEYSWVMPDNFHVQFNVEKVIKKPFTFRGDFFTATYKVNEPIEQGRCLGANIAHSLDSLTAREAVRRCNILPKTKLYIEDVLDGKDSEYPYDAVMKKEDAEKLLPELLQNYEETGYFSVRILECITPDTVSILDDTLIAKCREVLDTIEGNTYDIVCIHDCFFTHPNNVEYMRKSVTYAYAELAKSTILDKILQETIKTRVAINHIPDLDKLILQSDYIIC